MYSLNDDILLEKIKKVKARKDDEARQKEESYQAAISQVEALTPRIERILKLANVLKENDIEIKSFSKESILADGYYHEVGLMRTKDNKFEYIGRYSGGACGRDDLYTNGKKTFCCDNDWEYHDITKAEKYRASEYAMGRLIEDFDEFEKKFYKFIEDLK